MATIAQKRNTTPLHGAGAFIRGIFATAAAVVSVIAEAHVRLAAYERLQALSDAQLAARGLTREDIIAHVFRAA